LTQQQQQVNNRSAFNNMASSFKATPPRRARGGLAQGFFADIWAHHFAILLLLGGSAVGLFFELCVLHVEFLCSGSNSSACCW